MVPDALSRVTRFKPAASLNVIQTVVNPDYRLCDAINCLKPDDDIIDWVQCAISDHWFYDHCVGIDPDNADDLDFTCSGCEDSTNNPPGSQIQRQQTRWISHGVYRQSPSMLLALQRADPC